MSKKFIAIISALALVVTLLAPVGVQEASAASNNSVDRIPQVSDSYEFNGPARAGAVGGVSDAVYLRIEEKNVGEFGTSEIFRLTLNNAKFRTATGGNAATADDAEMTANAYASANGDAISVTRLSDNTAEVTLTGAVSTSQKRVFNIPLYSEVTDKGEVTVTVEPRDSRVSGGTYTYAIAAGGGSVATIDKVETFAGKVRLSNIMIDETRINSLDDGGNFQNIKLRLPNGFEWANATDGHDFTINSSGFASVTGDGLISSGSIVTTEPTGAAPGYKMDGRDLTIRVSLNSSQVRGTLILQDLYIKATSRASFGDVTVNIRGDKVSDQDLVVAKHADYGVTVTAKGDPRELISGRWDAGINNPRTDTGTIIGSATASDEHKLQKLVIEETADGGWLDRRMRIEFPAGVKILRINQGGNSNMKSNNLLARTGNLEGADLGENFIEYSSIDADTGGRSKVELEFFVSVAADFSGDITAVVSGPAVGNEEFEVVLGKATPAVNVEVDNADLRVGRLNQSIGNITITENVKEAIQSSVDNPAKTAVLTVLLGRANDGINWAGVPNIEVTEGDLDLDIKGASVNGRTLTIPVKSESSKPSTIVISNAKVDLDRTVAEGEYKVYVGGTSIVQNHDHSTNKVNVERGLVDKSSVASISSLSVVTPAPGETRAKVEFVIDSTTYTVDGQEMTMDVAPYIKDSRTFLPVFFVAQALGVSENNIIWEPHSKTVTILKGDRIAKLQIGNNTLTVNGTDIQMDTAPEIKDGRTMLPIFFIGQALGAEVSWDGDTRTVTVEQ